MLLQKKRVIREGNKMTQFKVTAPIDVPLHHKGVLDPLSIEEFRTSHESEFSSCGCYIYVIPRKRGAEGFTPIYVGMTTRTFAEECFTADKLTKLNGYLLRNCTRRLVLFLIEHPKQPGRPNDSAIEDMENFLIHLAKDVNPNLINRSGTRPATWSIAGVIRPGPGKTSCHARALRQLLGLAETQAEQGQKSFPVELPLSGDSGT